MSLVMSFDVIHGEMEIHPMDAVTERRTNESIVVVVA